MPLCIVCGQPLPTPSRADTLTCSASCRTRRYRLAKQQATPTGSLFWRRQIRVLWPILFFQRTPTTRPEILAQAPDPLERPNSVPAQYWDSTLVAMNLLWYADEQLGQLLNWPDNKWGAPANPLTGDPDGVEMDIVRILHDQHDTLQEQLGKLSQLRGPCERWLAPHLVEFKQHLVPLRQQIRMFAQEVFGSSRYAIVYPPGLAPAAQVLRERVTEWWFGLNDEVE